MPKQTYIVKEKMTRPQALAIAISLLKAEAQRVTLELGHNHPVSKEMRQALKLLTEGN